jgi:RNA polymerase sigma-70 factor (ECF subfamily)
VKITRKRLERGVSRQRKVVVNGQPGRVLVEDGVVTDVLAIDVTDGLIQAIRIVRNPDKLRHLKA